MELAIVNSSCSHFDLETLILFSTGGGHDAQPLSTIESVVAALKAQGKNREAEALQEVVTIAVTSPDFGGKGFSTENQSSILVW